jgi:hypothetical protein
MTSITMIPEEEATKAVPRMMSEMMQNMMAHIGEGGFEPPEM